MRVVTILKTSTGASWLDPLMSALRDRGHETIVLLPVPDGPMGSRLRASGVIVQATAAPAQSRSPVAQLRGLFRLRNQLRMLHPDLLHYHLYASALAARFASAGLGIPRVHMVPGPLYLENRVIRWAERLLCRMDDVVICTSQHLRERYRRLGLPEYRLPVIPYGVDCNRFTPDDPAGRAQARAGLGLDPDEFVVLCLAFFYAPKLLVHRRAGIKGHEDLLAAWSQFVVSGGRGRLLLVGGGFGGRGVAYRESLRAATAPLPGADSVLWLGHVDDVRPYYAAADVSVSPSLSENYGAAAEASACGVPTIASLVGGLPELVDTSTGFLHPPGNALALAACLHAAAREKEAVRLTPRGQAARQRALEQLDIHALLPEYCRRLEAAASHTDCESA